MRSRFRSLEPLFPAYRDRRRRKDYQRRHELRILKLQGLEPRTLLSASLQVFDGSTQLNSGNSDPFGTVTVGSVDSQNLTLKNVGNSTLTISSDQLPGNFSTPTSTPISIAPNQYATFTVNLNTGNAGSFGGQMTLVTNDPGNQYFELTLSGTVQPPSSGGTLELLQNGTPLSNGANDSFGSVAVGSSDTQSLTVTNEGPGTLTVSSVNLPSGYSLSASLPFSLSPYQGTSLSVSLNTATAGTYSGQMSIQSSDTTHNPFTLNLTGTVTSSSPAIELQDAGTAISNGGSDSFGSVTEGASDTRTYTVTDQGSSTLTVSSVSLPSGYSLQTSLPLSVAAGNSANFVVGLNTSYPGTFSGTMAITSNSTQNNPFDVSLSGLVTGAPNLTLYDGNTQISSGGSDSFGSVTQGSSDSRTYTVTNAGSGTLTVSGVSLPSGYTLQTSLPLSVAAGNSANFVVALSTGTIGTFNGTMAITSNSAQNNPFDVSLSGAVTGTPNLSLYDGSTQISSGGSDSFGSATQGSSGTRIYTVNNPGNGTLRVGRRITSSFAFEL
ncbi:MAG TPA: choice-of-anchor D domain-containing protein [Pirellulales bacterium]|nr:choice-of-anchor D domain-containing protein [Pirellulales bacterium]